MTLLPVEPIRVTIPAQEGWVKGETSERCANPECDQRGTETHEVVRRSYTAGAKRWVAIDGFVIGNQVRLCHSCHEDITQHRAWIRYLTGEGWVWYAAPPAGAGSPGSGSVQHPKSGRWFARLGPLKGV